MREHSWKKLLVHGYEYSRMPTVLQQAVETIKPILSTGITVGAQRRRRARTQSLLSSVVAPHTKHPKGNIVGLSLPRKPRHELQVASRRLPAAPRLRQADVDTHVQILRDTASCGPCRNRMSREQVGVWG
jgi:hypothetical protein